MYSGFGGMPCGQTYQEVVATRENEDGETVSEEVQPFARPQIQGGNKKSSAWCEGFELELVEESEVEEVVVRIRMVDCDGDVVAGPVRVRFKVIRYYEG
jgi:hypothetical protein